MDPTNPTGAEGTATAPTGAEGGYSATSSAVEQPQTGRGDVDHLQGLYEEHLQAVPEHLRPTLQEALHDINRGVGRRLQEAAEFRQQFEPLSQVEGLTDADPEELQGLLGIRDMLAAAADEANPNDEPLYDWWQKMGEHFGFFPEGDQPDEEDDGGGDFESNDEPPPWAQQLIESVQGFDQWRQQFEHQQRSTQAEQRIQRQLDQLAEQHNLDDDAQRSVLQLSLAYEGAEDQLARGLQDYFGLTGKGEQALLQGVERSASNGSTVPSGGTPSAGEQEPLRFGDPGLREAAKARLLGRSNGAAT